MIKNGNISNNIFTHAELSDAAKQTSMSRSAIGYYLTQLMLDEGAGYACLLLLDDSLHLKKAVCLKHGHGEIRESIGSVIARESSQLGSGYFVIAHNHYNKPLIPSPEDLFTTDMLRRRYADGNIHFLEHYIISGTDYITLSDTEHRHIRRYGTVGDGKDK